VQKIINADPDRLHTSKNAAFAIAMATEMFIQHLATTTHNVVKAERKPRRNIQYRDTASAVAKTDNLEFLVDVVPKTMSFKEFKKRKEESEKVKASVVAKNGAVDKDVETSAEVEKNGEVDTEVVVVASSNSLPPNPFAAAAAGAKSRTNGHSKKDEVGPSVPPSEPLSAGADTISVAIDTDAMDVDEAKEEKVEDSEPEEDGAAMQIEMEMRGPRTNGSPEVPRKSGGFTAINGK
jgi:DNA polymerase epsilon subunit 4